MIRILILLFVFLCFFSTMGNAEKILYVTDELEITLRTGPSIDNKILRMLSSGTKLYPLGEVQDGWIKVKTESGIEGWVLEKYTVLQPPAILKLKRCEEKTKKLSVIIDKNRELNDKLNNLKKEYEELRSKYNSLKRDASNIETIKNNFLTAKEKLKTLTKKVLKLERENFELRSKKNIYWFSAGALTVIFSFLIGFIIGKIQKRRNRTLYF